MKEQGLTIDALICSLFSPLLVGVKAENGHNSRIPEPNIGGRWCIPPLKHSCVPGYSFLRGGVLAFFILHPKCPTFCPAWSGSSGHFLKILKSIQLLHFLDGDTMAHTALVVFPKSHSFSTAKLGSEPRPSVPTVSYFSSTSLREKTDVLFFEGNRCSKLMERISTMSLFPIY